MHFKEAIADALAAAGYPELSVALGAAVPYPLHMPEKYKPYLDVLNKAVEDKHIWNVDYKEATEMLGRGFEATEKLMENILAPYFGGDSMKAGSAFYSITTTLAYITSVNKLIREYEKWLKKPSFPQWGNESKTERFGAEEPTKENIKGVQEMVKMFKSWVPVYHLRKEAKKYIEKGRKPNPNAKPPYQPPPQARESLKKVEKMLSDLIESKKKALATGIEEMTWERVGQYIKKQPVTEPFDKYFDKDPGLYMLAKRMLIISPKQKQDIPKFIISDNSFYNLRGYWKEGVNIEFGPNAKAVAADDARRAADDIAKAFVYKNMKKLTAIIAEKEKQSKAVMTKADPGRTSYGRGAFEGELDFEFSDGTSFTVRNKVVYKWSARGTSFVQYPTTFHEVKFPDGKVKAMRSEKQMNTEWVKA
jgi:hypothetical protein